MYRVNAKSADAQVLSRNGIIIFPWNILAKCKYLYKDIYAPE